MKTPAPRQLLATLVLVVLLIAAAVPAVSAADFSVEIGETESKNITTIQYRFGTLLIASASLLVISSIRWRVPRPAALGLTALTGGLYGV